MWRSFAVFAPTSHIKMTTPPTLLSLHFSVFWKKLKPIKVECKWCTNTKMHHKGWGLGTRLRNADTCASEQLKYRSLDGEATECRLCKYCGCMHKPSDYIQAQEKIGSPADQKQETNFVWPCCLLFISQKNMCTKCVPSTPLHLPTPAHCLYTCIYIYLHNYLELLPHGINILYIHTLMIKEGSGRNLEMTLGDFYMQNN